MQGYRKIGHGATLTMALAAGLALTASAPAMATSPFTFNMGRSAGLPATCAPGAHAHVTVTELGFTEKVVVKVENLPNTALDFFIIQVPHAPFGLSWYMADLDTDASGTVTKTFFTRANEETFAVAPGVAPAPKPHGARDAGSNPAFKPVHTFHLGIWFDSPAEAAKNGCPATGPTPFNGTHTAGIQVLNTATFPDNFGPLRHVF
jgi:hypothetical protein